MGKSTKFMVELHVDCTIVKTLQVDSSAMKLLTTMGKLKYE